MMVDYFGRRYPTSTEFGEVEKRLDEQELSTEVFKAMVEGRFHRVDDKLEGIKKDVTAVDKRIDGVKDELKQLREVATKLLWLVAAVVITAAVTWVLKGGLSSLP